MTTNHPQAAKALVPKPEAKESEGVDEARQKLIETSLCVNCTHLWECVFPIKAASPIFECELHECGPSVTPRLILLKTEKHGCEASAVPGGKEPLGLCANCDNLAHCRLPKNPGGVWHCEEYE